MPRWLVGLAAIRQETLLLGGSLGIAALAHGLNMGGYPAFSLADDEGIYVSQALAVLNGQGLAPYTYTYDHAPGGWLQLALWYLGTGGPSTFGTPIDGGRVLMLLLHLGSAFLLFRVARRLGAGPIAAAVAVLLFSLSPIAVFFQRMVLLDNVMVFWLLAALVLLLRPPSRAATIGAGVAFGLALLSKETSLIAAPVYLALLVRHAGWRQAGLWAGAVALTCLPYPLYALLRGELWPVSDPYLPYVIGNDALARPSLLSTLGWQLTRYGGEFWSFDNNFFWYLRHDWLWRDATLLAVGTAAMLANALRGLRGDRRLIVAAALGLVTAGYLARGGIVFSFYVVLLVPFLALNLALLFDPVLRRFPRPAALRLAASALVLFLGVAWWSGTLQPLYTEQPSDPARTAAAWMKAHVPADARIIGRDDLFPLLREPVGGPAFPNYTVHWKVAHDPAIRAAVFAGTWSTVDYLVISDHVVDDFWGTDDRIAIAAQWNAHRIARWAAPPGNTAVHAPQYVEIWEADRLRSGDRAAFAISDATRGRDQICGPRVATCDIGVELAPLAARDRFAPAR
ncbi:MAG TPA: glycosyltransferase family 39 protein [Candidatus Limnocylindria bacterium]